MSRPQIPLPTKLREWSDMAVPPVNRKSIRVGWSRSERVGIAEAARRSLYRQRKRLAHCTSVRTISKPCERYSLTALVFDSSA